MSGDCTFIGIRNCFRSKYKQARTASRQLSPQKACKPLPKEKIVSLLREGGAARSIRLPMPPIGHMVNQKATGVSWGLGYMRSLLLRTALRFSSVFLPVNRHLEFSYDFSPVEGLAFTGKSRCFRLSGRGCYYQGWKVVFCHRLNHLRQVRKVLG